MTYKKRLEMAIDYAQITPAELARRVRELLPRGHSQKKKFSDGQIHEALKRGERRKIYPSAYNELYAIACGVNSAWLSYEIGEMTGPPPDLPAASVRKRANRTASKIGVVAFVAALFGAPDAHSAAAGASQVTEHLIHYAHRRRRQGCRKNADTETPCGTRMIWWRRVFLPALRSPMLAR